MRDACDMAFALQWEREERQATALWVAGLSAGADVPSPADVWEQFVAGLASPPTRMGRDELALRRVLGVA